MITVNGGSVYPGAHAFKLHDTHGFPLSSTMEECFQRGIECIAWDEYIDCAREHGWWDFKIIEHVEESIMDSVVWRERNDAILNGIRRYMMEHPHPAMRDDPAYAKRCGEVLAPEKIKI